MQIDGYVLIASILTTIPGWLAEEWGWRLLSFTESGWFLSGCLIVGALLFAVVLCWIAVMGRMNDEPQDQEDYR